jgi:hypothetical protein
LRWSCGFFPLILLMCCITFFDCICQIILASLKWNQLILVYDMLLNSATYSAEYFILLRTFMSMVIKEIIL